MSLQTALGLLAHGEFDPKHPRHVFAIPPARKGVLVVALGNWDVAFTPSVERFMNATTALLISWQSAMSQTHPPWDRLILQMPKPFSGRAPVDIRMFTHLKFIEWVAWLRTTAALLVPGLEVWDEMVLLSGSESPEQYHPSWGSSWCGLVACNHQEAEYYTISLITLFNQLCNRHLQPQSDRSAFSLLF